MSSRKDRSGHRGCCRTSELVYRAGGDDVFFSNATTRLS